MIAYPLETIVDLLDLHHQRATYRAVAELLGITQHELVHKCPTDRRHSWMVNGRTERPSHYHAAEIHPAHESKARIIADRAELLEWLQAVHPVSA